MKRHIIALMTICLTGVTVLAQDGKDDASVVATLTNYAAAIQSKDMAEIEKYAVTNNDFTIFEGGHINWGWADYRDHHLGPELKQFLEIKYSFADIKPHIYGDIAYATLKSSIAVKMERREFEGESLATAVLVKRDGNWKIKHLHTSRIPRRRGNH